MIKTSCCVAGIAIRTTLDVHLHNVFGNRVRHYSVVERLLGKRKLTASTPARGVNFWIYSA